jgi:hypothetical protein
VSRRNRRTSARPAGEGRPKAPAAKRTQRKARVAAIGLGIALTMAIGALSLFVWSFLHGPGAGRILRFGCCPEKASGLWLDASPRHD